MKKIIYSLILVSPLAFANLSVPQIEKMVEKIHEKREGVKLETLQTTKEPFVRLEHTEDVVNFVIPQAVEDDEFNLHAIINGKAYINNKWYETNNTIAGYVIKSITTKSVEMTDENNKTKKLFLHKSKDNFIQIEERK
jgi:hypothetical protein